MIKLLGIKGSPRKESNSNLMLDKAVEGSKDNSQKEVKPKIINPTKMNINPCRGCFQCDKAGKCIINDGMEQLYKEFDQADIVLVSTPVFFNGVSAQLKTMIDRCQAIWGSKYGAQNSLIDREKERVGFLLAAGGAPAYREQFTAVRKVSEMFFRVINTDWKGELSISNTDENPVTEREDILKKAYQTGKELVSSIS